MVDLPQKKVGIVACSGEELAEGTVTRLAALKVLEQLRPKDTVTICLPLFLAGGEGERMGLRVAGAHEGARRLTSTDRPRESSRISSKKCCLRGTLTRS